jgi:hypothetical protein
MAGKAPTPTDRERADARETFSAFLRRPSAANATALRAALEDYQVAFRAALLEEFDGAAADGPAGDPPRLKAVG